MEHAAFLELDSSLLNVVEPTYEEGAVDFNGNVSVPSSNVPYLISNLDVLREWFGRFESGWTEQ